MNPDVNLDVNLDVNDGSQILRLRRRTSNERGSKEEAESEGVAICEGTPHFRRFSTAHCAMT